MRPPQCDVCGADSPSEAMVLVRCVSTAADLEWRQRSEAGEIVGHPPDTGWFCGEHQAQAAELASSLPLGQVVARLLQDAAPGVQGGLSISRVWTQMVALMPQILEGAGMGGVEVVSAEDKTWNPMDGAMPPDCPFVSRRTHEASHDGAVLACLFEVAHWSEVDPARSHLSLSLRGAGDHDFSFAVWSPASGDFDGVEDTSERGAVPAAVRELVGGAS